MPIPQNPLQDHLFWNEHIALWRTMEISQTAYCKEQQLCRHKFGYYKRKLSAEALPCVNKPSAFISLQLQPKSHYEQPLMLHFNNGMHLSGITDNNLSMVKQLAELLS